MARSALKALPVLAFAASLCMTHRAGADAPRDMQTNQRLWLDGLDIYGTDTAGNGDGTRPSAGSGVPSWQDKSPNRYVATSWSAAPPTATADSVSCTASSGFTLSNGIYPVGTSVTASDVYAVVNTRSDLWSHLIWQGAGGSRISIDIPYAGNIYWDHSPSTGRLSASWSGSGSAYNTTYLWNFGIGGGTQAITRNGANVASQSSSGSYLPLAGQGFVLCGGEGAGFDGTVSEIIVFARRLATAERNIMHSYLAAKHGVSAGTANKYTVPGNFRYYLGGIGQESDGSLTTGTAAGLTIANGTYLANGRYLLAGVDSLSPARGGTTTDRPTGYAQRAQRVWYLHRTATGSPGTVTLTFNLSQIGVTVNSGATVGLGYRSAATGTFTALQAVTHNGASTVSFTVTNPSAGYYTLAIPEQPTYSLAASLSGTTANDFVNSANFKAIPGALIRATATVTNTGTGNPDSNSTTVSLPIPANMKFYLGDIGVAGQGPVQFAQGAVASGLSYTYSGLTNAADGLEFSSNSGATWTYQPTADAQQADAAITQVRVKPTGTFNTGTSPNFPSFTVTYGLIIK